MDRQSTLKLQVVYRGKTWLFDGKLNVFQVLRRLSVLPESVLVVRDGRLITEDEWLHPGDTVRVIPVVSGG